MLGSFPPRKISLETEEIANGSTVKELPRKTVGASPEGEKACLWRVWWICLSVRKSTVREKGPFLNPSPRKILEVSCALDDDFRKLPVVLVGNLWSHPTPRPHYFRPKFTPPLSSPKYVSYPLPLGGRGGGEEGGWPVQWLWKANAFGSIFWHSEISNGLWQRDWNREKHKYPFILAGKMIFCSQNFPQNRLWEDVLYCTVSPVRWHLLPTTTTVTSLNDNVHRPPSQLRHQVTRHHNNQHITRHPHNYQHLNTIEKKNAFLSNLSWERGTILFKCFVAKKIEFWEFWRLALKDVSEIEWNHPLFEQLCQRFWRRISGFLITSLAADFFHIFLLYHMAHEPF